MVHEVSFISGFLPEMKAFIFPLKQTVPVAVCTRRSKQMETNTVPLQTQDVFLEIKKQYE